ISTILLFSAIQENENVDFLHSSAIIIKTIMLLHYHRIDVEIRHSEFNRRYGVIYAIRLFLNDFCFQESEKMETKIYDVLPPEAIQIRTAVFIGEQGFKNEFDKIDDIAKHLVALDGKTAIATCRLFEQEVHQYTVGRIAVIQSYRGKTSAQVY
ncbi:MAG: hypothetical protein LUD80_01020, partial [Clostridiales bacterium]|nr:hypothetical protein [Clostridiales bacterium]